MGQQGQPDHLSDPLPPAPPLPHDARGPDPCARPFGVWATLWMPGSSPGKAWLEMAGAGHPLNLPTVLADLIREPRLPRLRGTPGHPGQVRRGVSGVAPVGSSGFFPRPSSPPHDARGLDPRAQPFSVGATLWMPGSSPGKAWLEMAGAGHPLNLTHGAGGPDPRARFPASVRHAWAPGASQARRQWGGGS